MTLLTAWAEKTVKKSNEIYKFEKEVRSILKKASPSIVKVVAENDRKHVATGIVINKNLILSNIMITKYHYDTIYAVTRDKQKIPVKLLGKDKRTGLILLKHKSPNLKPIQMGKTAMTGDWILLVGAFYSKVPAVYTGIVSSSSQEELILNAPLPPGAVGSAVLNRDGNLVGVVRGKLRFSTNPSYSFKNEGGRITILSKHSKGENLCYAVPRKKVKSIVSQLLKYGKVKWGWLGVNIDYYKKKKGVLITSIIPNSPASRSNLKKGDVIVNINNQEINTMSELQRAIRQIIPGEKAKFIVSRDGKENIHHIKIGEMASFKKQLKSKTYFKYPKNSRKIQHYFEDYSRFPKLDIEKFKINITGTPKLGVIVKTLGERDARKFKVPENHGLLITELTKGGSAEKYGLKKWDVLIRSGKKEIKSKEDLLFILTKSKPHKKIPFTVSRNGNIETLYVVPKQNISFDKNILKRSLKDMALLLSEDFKFDEHSRSEFETLKRKTEALKAKSREMSGDEKIILEQKLVQSQRKLNQLYKSEYRKIPTEIKKLQIKLKKLEAEWHKSR